MTKDTKSVNLISSVNEIIETAKARGIIHLFTQDARLNGRIITLKGKKLVNFGSCSYLGLETDKRLKKASIDAVDWYGTQYSSSRTYVSCGNYEELEELIGQMFDAPILLSTSSTLGHQSVLPIVVDSEDVVIYDQQAHISMQEVMYKLKHQGTAVDVVRHSRLDELERKIIELSPKHNKVWYAIDGVYSMYGDFAPIKEIETLMNKHQKFHLYADCAHGFGWTGKNGTGYILSQIGMHPKMIIAVSLAKSFASAGGVFVFPNVELRDRVKNWGGPLTYSGPQQPAVVGASIASAKIHLTDEITDLQGELLEKIKYCNLMLKKYKLPLVAESDNPIFFIGLGLTKMGYNMVKRLFDEGLYVNLGIFPAVPERCTGIRFTITKHHTLEDIETLAQAIAYHLPEALEEEGRTMNDIYRAFRKVPDFGKRFKDQIANPITTSSRNSEFKIQHETTIQNIPQELWDELLGDNGAFDWQMLFLMERTFQNNPKPEDNWSFHYYIIRDSQENPVLATFFTVTVAKDDMLASAEVSREIEEKRKEKPYYLTSLTFSMGSLLTVGQHLYLDRNHTKWKEIMMQLLDAIWEEQERQEATVLNLRDFDAEDIEMREFLMDQGFIKIDMPDNNVVESVEWKSQKEFLEFLPSHKRRKVKKDILQGIDKTVVLFNDRIDMRKLDHWYQLFSNVASKNYDINVFPTPKKLFENILDSPENWDFIELYPKTDQNNLELDQLIGVGLSYKTRNYCTILLGLDYEHARNYNAYRQMLFYASVRAGELEMKKIYLGVTATGEKNKVGAVARPQVAYVQMKDNFSLSLISQVSSG